MHLLGLVSFILALAGAVPSANALYWLRPRQSPKFSSEGRASTFAGLPTSVIFPPPSAVSTEATLISFFPEALQVGFAGPTPSKSSGSFSI